MGIANAYCGTGKFADGSGSGPDILPDYGSGSGSGPGSGSYACIYIYMYKYVYVYMYVFVNLYVYIYLNTFFSIVIVYFLLAI
jgi:hypothetical protein